MNRSGYVFITLALLAFALPAFAFLPRARRWIDAPDGSSS